MMWQDTGEYVLQFGLWQQMSLGLFTCSVYVFNYEAEKCLSMKWETTVFCTDELQHIFFMPLTIWVKADLRTTDKSL